MIYQGLHTNQKIHGYVVDRIEAIPELRTEATLFTHEKTGAKLLHLYNEDPNNLFCIAFRTPVFNNTGVPHILEHSVLSGSKKFPLKDPFKEMLKGSLQTFLNAMTYPDKTIYPVSSQVEKDFFNLVDVYCDAVFNPLLKDLTFFQEGWHFDVANPTEPVSIKGIVYNEMKGVFSDFRSHVMRKTISYLYPDTTYFYESGGDPENITDLTYEQFKAFHADYYHPSNSFTVLYGNISSEKTLGFMQKNYMKSFDRREVNSNITAQPLWKKERTVSFSAPSSKEDDGTATVIISWIFGESTDPMTTLLGHLFSHYFFNNHSSPLRRALINSGLGEDLDDMCGFDSDLIQGIFVAGLRKTKPEHADAIKKVIYDTLITEFENSMDGDLLEGAIRQIEFRLREITDGGHFPHNLMLAERAYRSWLYGGDPLAHLLFEPLLNTLKEKRASGTGWFAEKMKKLLIDNKHNLLSIVTASAKLGEQLGKKTDEQAALLSKDFTQGDIDKYHELTKKLLAEQIRIPSDKEVATLPKLSRKDIPRKREQVPTNHHTFSGVDGYIHPLFTAGIIYLDFGFDLGGIDDLMLPYFPLYCELLTRCGAAGFSSDEMAKRISLITGDISCSDTCSTRFGTNDDLFFKLFFHGKALLNRANEMIKIFHDIFTAPVLNDKKLIKEILFEMRNELNGSIIRSGHQHAIAHAASNLQHSRYIEETIDGVSQLRFLDQLIAKDSLSETAEMMEKLHKIIINKHGAMISITAEDISPIEKSLCDLFNSISNVGDIKKQISFKPVNNKRTGIEVSSSVNYVARVWRLKPFTPQSMGEHFLLARNLSTGYLWDKVRVEGGAYGGMSIISSDSPLFACASYRDPNISSTLSHFEGALKNIAAGIDESEVEQTIIGAIGRLDAPKSPHSKGFSETLALLQGQTNEIRQQVRDAIINADASILAKRAQNILDEREDAITVFGSSDAFDHAESESVVLNREKLLDQ